MVHGNNEIVILRFVSNGEMNQKGLNPDPSIDNSIKLILRHYVFVINEKWIRLYIRYQLLFNKIVCFSLKF